MSFKTSHGVKKKPGRWSAKKRKAIKTYSCPFCFTRNEEPPRKASDGMPYCSRCFAHTGEFQEVKQIKAYVSK